MLKAELRKRYLDKRARLAEDERETMSAHLVGELFERMDFSEIGVLHTYLPIERFHEIDTWSLVYRIWSTQSHVQVCAPRIQKGENALVSVTLERTTQMTESEWGVPEPIGEGLIYPHQIDVIIVPLLCADVRGYRVGYGKGYYDGYLAKCRDGCRKIGLSFFPPIEEITDVDEFDVKIDELIYPTSS